MPTDPPVQAVGIDHVVLKVRDVERSVAWYRDLLGLEPERLEEWRRQEVLFVSLRVDGTTLVDLLQAEPDGVNVDHVAFLVEPTDLQAAKDSGRFEVDSGPAELFGAQGTGLGIYVRDPDGHLVELRTY
jgi:catechol 2,3-dioxygenase-like lactoylglutathione lyase family enzyme